MTVELEMMQITTIKAKAKIKNLTYQLYVVLPTQLKEDHLPGYLLITR